MNRIMNWKKILRENWFDKYLIFTRKNVSFHSNTKSENQSVEKIMKKILEKCLDTRMDDVEMCWIDLPSKLSFFDVFDVGFVIHQHWYW